MPRLSLQTARPACRPGCEVSLTREAGYIGLGAHGKGSTAERKSHRRAGGGRPARRGSHDRRGGRGDPRETTHGHTRRGLTRALEAIGTAAYVVDEEGRVIAVNAHAEQLLVRPAEEFLGRDAHDLLHRDAHGHPLPRSRCDMRQAFHAGRTAQAEGEHFECGDGSLLPVSWMITPYVVDGREEARSCSSTPSARRRPSDDRRRRPAHCRNSSGSPCWPRPPPG